MYQDCHIRIARPTDQLDLVSQFYIQVLGFELLGEFRDHDGFDGVMVGHSDAPYHLEFTQNSQHPVGRAPSKDHLLVIYVSDKRRWTEIIGKIKDSGAKEVQSFNPYWDRHGRTFEDPDGYRIVIQHGSWPQSEDRLNR